jgi:hypothetical protein
MSFRFAQRSRLRAFAILALLCAGHVQAQPSLMDAITKGKVDFYARLRYEYVSDDAFAVAPARLEDADSLTLRTALGYNTGLFHKFGAYLQFEDVQTLVDDYNDGSFTAANGLGSNFKFATVVDPEGTEVQQANLRYEHDPFTMIRVGRQEIEHRQAPLHRYIGNILWRQNWQTFDAVRATAALFPDVDTGLRRLNLDYAYVWNVNRIFGEDNNLPDRADFPMNSHFFKANWDGFNLIKLEGYGYTMHFDHGDEARLGGLSNVANSGSFGLSAHTIGIRGEGMKGLGRKWKVLYTGEFAHQADAYDNPADINVNYALGEGGLAYEVKKKWLDTITVKVSYEVLEGDGVVLVDGVPIRRSFQTPLGTNHAFQGWADKFLTTPGDGIEDLFGTLRLAGVFGANILLMYHDFSSNNDAFDYDYGTEWDVIVEKPFMQYWSVGIKYSEYNADDNPTNLARNTTAGGVGQAFDREIFWAWVQFKF